MRILLFLTLMLGTPLVSADASVLSNNLTFDGVVDTLQDASAGNIIERAVNGSAIDGTLEAGDIIQGIVHFNTIGLNFPPTGGSVFAAYSFEIVTASAAKITVKAATGDYAIKTMLAGDNVDMSKLSAYNGRSGDVGLVVLETTTSGVTLNDKKGLGSGRFDGTKDGNSDTFAGEFSSGWTAVLAGGFLGTDQHVITSAEGVDINNLTSILAVGGGNQFGSFGGVYSVLEAAGSLGGSTEYRAIANSFSGFDSTLSGDIVIQDGSLYGFKAPNDGGVNGSNWTFQDDGSYQINAIPEPSTIAIWAALGLGGCGFVARRRMKAKKA